MKVDFYIQGEEDSIGQRVMDAVPRIGETVTMLRRTGLVTLVAWGDFLDGKGFPTGEMLAQVEFEG